MPKRRTFVLGITGVAGIVAWRYRVPQVGTFMVAAGLRKLLIPDPAPDFPTLAPQWPTLQPTRTYSFSGSRGMITYHPWYHNFSPSIASKVLAEAAELGCGYTRIDIRWKDLIPDGQNVDEAAWSWYEGYLRAARNWYSLRPLIVLSNAPRAVQGYSADSRLAAWRRYVNEVAYRAGHQCMIYQPLNEPNNPVFRIFPTKTTASAIIMAAKTIKQHNPDAQIAINILAGLWEWQSDLQEIVRESGSAVDIVGLDYYPGTWTLSSKSDAANWNQFTDVIARARKTRTSPLYNRLFGIIETGYATNLRCFRSEQQQVSYSGLWGTP